MNGLPHNAKVPLLGFADTAAEAQQAASEIFDVWLEQTGLKIAPPVTRRGDWKAPSRSDEGAPIREPP
jgi:hypothetical protein